MAEIITPGVSGGTRTSSGLIVPRPKRVARATGSGPMPGAVIKGRDEENMTRLFAVWTRNTPFIGAVSVAWAFVGRLGVYSGTFDPDADCRNIGTAENEFVYKYDPAPGSPFLEGNFADHEWEAWSIAAPSSEVTAAEIDIYASGEGVIVMLGAAVMRNRDVACTDGPHANAAHCYIDFTEPKTT